MAAPRLPAPPPQHCTQGKRKTGRLKTTWRRKLLYELQDEKISSLSDASNHAKLKKDRRTIVHGLRSTYNRWSAMRDKIEKNKYI